jgi:death on curing protein
VSESDTSAPEIEYLSVADLIRLTRRLGAGPVSDLGLLDSAAHRPRASLLGLDAYPTIGLKAAALLHSLGCNHALVDGNKRLGFLATVVFLSINGRHLDLSDDEAFRLVCDVASGELDVTAIELRLRLVRTA